MNVKEYINSGIVESYVLGLATDAERQEFEQMCSAHAEIAEARDAFERSLEIQLMQDAVTPPAFVKEKIFDAIKPAVVETDEAANENSAPVRRMNVWKLAAAACFIGLLGVGYWAYTTNEKNKELEGRQAGIEKELQQKNTELTALQQGAEPLHDPGVKMVVMKSTEKTSPAYATIYWDTTSTKDVYLMVNNLPQPATDKQYQLWAIINGKPTDLGLIDYDVHEKRLLVRMKNVQNAQAFAISLEKKGGSSKEVPEGAVVVAGNL